MLSIIFSTITSITAFSVTKKLKKSRVELRQHYLKLVFPENKFLAQI
jgi:hypothetical protein